MTHQKPHFSDKIIDNINQTDLYALTKQKIKMQH